MQILRAFRDPSQLAEVQILLAKKKKNPEKRKKWPKKWVFCLLILFQGIMDVGWQPGLLGSSSGKGCSRIHPAHTQKFQDYLACHS